jgi:drug/metabolite transporter (DMT)-like permease
MSQAPQPGQGGKDRGLGAAALAGLALIWGYGWIVVKVGLGYVEPFTYAALRSVLTCLVLFSVVILLRRPLRLIAPGLVLLIGLLQTSAFIAFSMWAVAHTGAGKTSVLTYTMPFWLLLLAWLFLGERLHDVQWPAVALAFAGLVLVVSPWNVVGTLASAMAVLGGLSWAGSAVVTKVLHRRHKVDLLSLTAWQMLLGTPALLALAAFTYSGPPQWTPTFIGVLAFNVLLSNGVAWLLWLYTLRTLTAGGAGVGTLAVPIVGVFAAWLHLGERPPATEAVGMALIILALGLMTAREITMAGRRRRLKQTILEERTAADPGAP